MEPPICSHVRVVGNLGTYLCSGMWSGGGSLVGLSPSPVESVLTLGSVELNWILGQPAGVSEYCTVWETCPPPSVRALWVCRSGENKGDTWEWVIPIQELNFLLPDTKIHTLRSSYDEDTRLFGFYLTQSRVKIKYNLMLLSPRNLPLKPSL